jgi:NTP pyrophosphatase (non-canonical NTP hydrolase)
MKKVALEKRIEEILAFNKVRGWDPVACDLAKSVIIEAAELLEHFQWDDTDDTRTRNKKNWKEIELEVADVFWYLITFCYKSNIDLSAAIKKKMTMQEIKYPADKFNGKHNDKFYKQQKARYRKVNK